MSDNINKALADALAYGTGVMHKSDYVAYGDVHLSPRDSLSQHCPNCEAQAAEIEKLREALHTPLAFIEALHENDPDDQIADNGMTVLDGLKQQAPSVIKTIRAALGETK